MSAIELTALGGLPEIESGAELGALIAEAAELSGGEIVCISQKVVSKAEGRTRDLARVQPSARAVELAAQLGKDPALVEVVLGESARVVRAAHGVLITETHSGLICANAGVDASNVPGEHTVALLPEDPDRSARRIRAELRRACDGRVGVIVADSFGRPWRVGQTDVAIGCAGIEPLQDWRGKRDAHGHELRATAIAAVDQLAAAADLAREKLSRTPVVLIRGLERLLLAADGPGASALRRPADSDLFR